MGGPEQGGDRGQNLEMEIKSYPYWKNSSDIKLQRNGSFKIFLPIQKRSS